MKQQIVKIGSVVAALVTTLVPAQVWVSFRESRRVGRGSNAALVEWPAA